MKTIKIFFPLIFILVSLFSCTKTIEYNGPELNEKLVLFSFGNVGQNFEVNLSHSQFSLARSQSNLTVNDAVVRFSVNGQSSQKMQHKNNGVYVSSYVIQQGDVISVEVTHPKYQTIHATATVPKQCEYNYNIIEEGFDYANIELVIHDASYDNYYNLTGQATFELTFVNGGDSYLELESDGYSSIDPLLKRKEKGISIEKAEIKTYFLDQTFQNEDRKIAIRFDTRQWSYEIDELNGCQKRVIKIDLSELSYSYYAYKTSIETYYEHDNDIFAEKTQIYSNVENGLGVLAFRTPHVVVINK